MPLYEYQCDACAHRFERIQKFSDPPVEVCPSCGGAVRKLVSSPAFQFKGSGWYVTDYARSGKSDGGEGDASKAGSADKPDKAGTEAADKAAEKAEQKDKTEKTEKTAKTDGPDKSKAEKAEKPGTQTPKV